jgi:hypothetical protein
VQRQIGRRPEANAPLCRGDFTSAQTQPKVAFGALDKEPSRTLRGNLLKNLSETAEKQPISPFFHGSRKPMRNAPPAIFAGPAPEDPQHER